MGRRGLLGSTEAAGLLERAPGRVHLPRLGTGPPGTLLGPPRRWGGRRVWLLGQGVYWREEARRPRDHPHGHRAQCSAVASYPSPMMLALSPDGAPPVAAMRTLPAGSSMPVWLKGSVADLTGEPLNT